MPSTSATDGHTHEYQDTKNQQVTSMDGDAPHLHIVPAWPATRTLVANDHDHELPTRDVPE